MSKVFRLGQGANTHTDWNKCNFPYDSNNRKNIEDPDGATVRKEITSIPSPFARIDLVKNAFREVVESRDLDGNTIHHKMVSDSLDIGEIFFNYDRFQDRVEIITWNPNESISELMDSGLDGCKYLGDALSKYLDADKAAYNFDKMQNIYILNYKRGKKELDIIGATSPKTLFFSNANDLSYLSEDLSFESDKPFDSELNPLYKRDHEYIKAWYIFRKNYPGFAEDFAELYDYLELTFKNLPDELRHEIELLSDNTRLQLMEAGQQVKDFLAQHSENQYLVIVEGQASANSEAMTHYNYELSFKRALSLVKFWDTNPNVKFPKKNCELQISGSGDGRLSAKTMRDFVEEKNQRFLIYIIPKNIIKQKDDESIVSSH